MYPRLDTVVGFYVEGLVTLDKAQSAALKRTLASNLDWHRQSELERYSAFLREMADTVAGGAGRDDWISASRRTEQYWREIFEQAAPGYTALAATFTDAQVAELLENLEREDEEDGATSRGASRSSAARGARSPCGGRWSVSPGRSRPAQRELIREHAASSQSFMAEWLENRRVWRDALAEALAGRRNGAEFEARMHVLIARPDELWTPRYRAAIEQRRESLIDFVVEFDATLTAPQRAAARRQLLALADEVQGLSRRRG